MQPASPVIEGYSEVVYAKDQPQYIPLPAIRTPEGAVITRWEMTWKERLKVLFTGSVYLSLLTYNHPLQPTRLQVDPPLDILEQYSGAIQAGTKLDEKLA